MLGPLRTCFRFPRTGLESENHGHVVSEQTLPGFFGFPKAGPLLSGASCHTPFVNRCRSLVSYQKAESASAVEMPSGRDRQHMLAVLAGSCA